MSLLDEFKHAIKDGLGSKEAALYKFSTWSNEPNSVIAYSYEKELMFLLRLAEGQDAVMSGDQYLDAAKSINNELGCFIVPNQKPIPVTYWGGKNRSPVLAFAFRVIEAPVRWR